MMPKYAHAISDPSPAGPAMRLTRCFVPPPLAAGAVVELPADAGAHLTRVLRLRVGAQLQVFDGTGGEYDAEIVGLERRGAVSIRLGAHQAADRESPLHIHLLQCLIRGERMDWLVQKSTELGVAAIVPVSSRHGVVQLEAAAAARRQEHWQRIVIGACEQSGRNRLPRVHAVQTLESACLGLRELQEPPALRVLLDPQGERSLAAAVGGLTGHGTPLVLALLVGPEGGFSEEERLLIERGGFVPCRLGPRVMRAETAPLAAIATLQSLLGDLR